MNDMRSNPTGPGAPQGDDEVTRDLQALRHMTSQSQPGLEATLRAARSRSAGESRKGWVMAIQGLKGRPVLASVAAVVVLALGMLVMPISYERTTGYDVALSLGGDAVGQEQVMGIARGLKASLGVQGVMVEAAMDDGRTSYVLTGSATGDVRAAAEAYAKELTALGYQASVQATPRKEKVSSNVYAYAMSRVIEIRTDGKSAPQLESEIRQRLAEAGVTNAEVSVRDIGEKGREVKVMLDHDGVGPAGDHQMPELLLTKDGQPMKGGFGIRVMKMKDASGATTTTLKITSASKNLDIEIPNAESMSDAALKATIESKLREAGIDAVVKVEGGHISVEKHTP